MKDIQKGLSISILVHGFILTALFATWIDKPIHPKIISLDFVLLNSEGSERSTGLLTGGMLAESEIVQQKRAEKVKVNAIDVDQKLRAIASASDLSFIQPQVSRVAAGIPSDNDGQVEVYGKAGSSSGEGEPGTNISSPAKMGQPAVGGGPGGNEGHIIRYGSGSTDEKTFRYIRDGILKNIKYPEKARRKGLAGKTLLSFMVSEGGSTHDVKIINSSGATELDNSAKEAVVKTRFSHKIPYKLFVILPIEYRLE